MSDTAATAAAQAAAQSGMFREAAEAAERVQVQLDRDAAALVALGAELRRLRPRAVVTCARGSSDHAATYLRYLVETRLGLLTASASPSVSSVYRSRIDLAGCLFIAISQSGRSPDLLAAAVAARDAGATVIAMVNVEDAPLADLAHHSIAVRAGPEHSVAATKSYLCTLAAMLHLVAHWSQSAPLLDALAKAPGQLAAAWRLDWNGLVDALVPARHFFIVGRGLGLGIAQEAALKFKETCALHADAYSSAEVQHGPMALLSQDLPVLILGQGDETQDGLDALAATWTRDGVRVWVAGPATANPGITGWRLPTVPAAPVIAPLLLAQSLYRVAATLAVARGLDPDRPPRLNKVTETC